MGEVQRISPSPKSNAKHAMCSADVALFTANACLAPTNSATDFSNSGT